MHFAADDLQRRENDGGARDGEEVQGRGAKGGRDAPWLWS